MTLDEGEKKFRQLKEIQAKSGVPFVVHEHVPTRTNEEAERNLSYAVERIVMILARTSGKDIVQAALRVTRRVDYHGAPGKARPQGGEVNLSIVSGPPSSPPGTGAVRIGHIFQRRRGAA